MVGATEYAKVALKVVAKAALLVGLLAAWMVDDLVLKLVVC
jgi:hypothetical protein